VTPRLGFPIEAGRVALRASDGHVALERDGETVGTVRVSSSESEVSVDALCIEPERRGMGSGSAAARALIREAAQAGFETFRAWAPADRGLAVYFWFRMGLRPAPGEKAEDGIWLSRDLRALDG